MIRLIVVSHLHPEIHDQAQVLAHQEKGVEKMAWVPVMMISLAGHKNSKIRSIDNL